MSAYSPSPSFHNAASYLSGGSSLSKVSNETKLELYGLFKYVTVSTTPDASRPSLFDFTGRAKWDAWSNAGKIYKTGEDAEARYLEIAQSLGWQGDETPAQKTTAELEADDSSEPSIDYDNLDSEEGETGGSSGMGNAVSTIVGLEEDDEESLSNYAILGDPRQFLSYFEAHPYLDLNEPDENGYTPLHLAADRGNRAIVDVLLERGVDRTVKDPDDFTAFELAQVAGHDEIAALLKSP